MGLTVKVHGRDSLRYIWKVRVGEVRFMLASPFGTSSVVSFVGRLGVVVFFIIWRRQNSVIQNPHLRIRRCQLTMRHIRDSIESRV